MSEFRRKLMMAYAANKRSDDVIYPGLIAAWSAKGKNNDDADRAILKDLTGNGHDITLNGFAFNTEGSGYNNPLYPDALVFDGVDDYGINENIKDVLNGCEEYTVIAKRKYIDLSKNTFPIFSLTGDTSQTLFLLEHCSGNIYKTYNKGFSTEVVKFPDEISWQTNEAYNQQPIGQGKNTSVSGFIIGGGSGKQYVTVALYSYYIFNRTLPNQEIKAFIRKYIDPEYILPSEQTIE